MEEVWEAAGYTKGQHHSKQQVLLPRKKVLWLFVANYCKRLRLLQPPVNSRQHFTKRILAQKTTMRSRTSSYTYSKKKNHSEHTYKRLIARCCNCSWLWNGCSDKHGTISIGKSGCPDEIFSQLRCMLLQVLQEVARPNAGYNRRNRPLAQIGQREI